MSFSSGEKSNWGQEGAGYRFSRDFTFRTGTALFNWKRAMVITARNLDRKERFLYIPYPGDKKKKTPHPDKPEPNAALAIFFPLGEDVRTWGSNTNILMTLNFLPDAGPRPS